jgi:hypothetical protein
MPGFGCISPFYREVIKIVRVVLVAIQVLVLVKDIIRVFVICQK